MNKPVHILIIWFVVLGFCGYEMYSFYSTPGTPAHAPELWPSLSDVKLQPARKTLLVFLHPECTCSTATIADLTELSSEAINSLNILLIFEKTRGRASDLRQGELWKLAKAVTGAHLVIDENAREANLFGAFTSGQALLYDNSGRLLFQGGVTAGRGHAGESEGIAAIEALASGKKFAVSQTNTFGCELHASFAQQAGNK